MTTEELLLEQMSITRAEIQGRIITQRKYAEWNTYKSMKEVPLGFGRAGIEGWQYSGVLERPRKPDFVPADFVQILTRWANVKGISARFESKADFDRFIYNTHRAIREKGFNNRYTRDIFTTPLENLGNRLPLLLTEQFTTQITDKIWRLL
jgi:hypothetical protein